MLNFFKKYWDILFGVITGTLLTYVSDLQEDKIKLTYSTIILLLVSIGFFKIIKQSVDKNLQSRKDTIIDNLVNSQYSVKAVNLATNPTNEGEKLGKFLLDLFRGIKMKKFKEYFDKFKGFVLAGALTILSLVEMYGGFINDLFGGHLVICGYEVLPKITLVCAVVVGCISNPYSKEQYAKIKALFTKSNTNELVLAEIKRTLKETKKELDADEKLKSIKDNELKNLQSELHRVTEILQAKRQMLMMTPKLATDEDVAKASEEVRITTEKIAEKRVEISDLEAKIENVNLTINALQSQLEK